MKVELLITANRGHLHRLDEPGCPYNAGIHGLPFGPTASQSAVVSTDDILSGFGLTKAEFGTSAARLDIRAIERGRLIFRKHSVEEIKILRVRTCREAYR